MNYLDLTTTDPAFNLAVEEYVFEQLPRDRMYVMLWQNDNAIIIGKHQNTLAEINEAYVKEKNIRVVRRLSGGGAVYHDMGNLNFTVIADADGDNLDFGRFCRIVVRALARMGVEAQINGRNDMTIDGKKFSGNAQYLRQGRVMHHGTILFDSDGAVLANALQVDEEKIRAKGVKTAFVTLHVGLGTFRPVKAENILEHHMHAELCMLSAETAAILNETKANGGRIICVGTTSCRTLESLVNDDGTFEAKTKWTEIFIYPGYIFKAMDGLITNFHLPESTLVMLVSAFAGRENVLNAYKEAVASRYRFFSFGDAMAVL